MRIPTIRGLIARRILVNFAVDPKIAEKAVPRPFKPKIINGQAIAGICLIRLNEVRPKGMPAFLGISSENGAHRIAVEWEEDDQIKEGVYIPRRDTSSYFNTLAGGRVFPGKHHRAKFDTYESDGQYHVSFVSSDNTIVSVDATITDKLSDGSIFADLQTASAFFKRGSAGYSPNSSKYDGMLLNTFSWEVTPLKVTQVRSSFFENKNMFPEGSVKFDDALLMTNIPHEWSSLPDKQRCI